MTAALGSNDAIIALQELAARRDTGELICVGTALEVHIYLQHGRIAWATCSDSRLAFVRYLRDRCGLDRDALHEVVEECRRSRIPLGEMLVAWRLLSTDDVRRALRHQVEETLATLARHRDARTLFLGRGGRYRDYDVALTFDVEEVWPRGLGEVESWTGDHDCVRRVAKSLPDVRWALALRQGRVTARFPAGTPGGGVDPYVAGSALEDGVDLVAVRYRSGTLVGFRREPPGASLWMCLDSRVTLGLVASSLAAFGHVGPTARDDLPRPKLGDELRGAPEAGCDCSGVLAEVMERTPGLLAGAVAHERQPLSPLSRAGVDSSEVARVATDRLDVVRSLFDAVGRCDDTESGPDAYRSVLFGRRRGWHFAMDSFDASGRSIWLVVDRAESQGLGWALLSAVARQLRQVPCALSEGES